MGRGLLRSAILLAALALHGQSVSAQVRIPDQVYQLYLSSSTPPQYKRILRQIIRMNDLAGGRPAKSSSLSLAALSVAPPAISVSARVLASDPTFTFHAAYAFPNPVRGVSAVTIRIQPGLADSVEVHVYDLAERMVHASSDFTLNPNFNDGNGTGEQYTYDHVWDISGMGSGVYFYVITARKSGQADIHKAGRIGIVK